MKLLLFKWFTIPRAQQTLSEYQLLFYNPRKVSEGLSKLKHCILLLTNLSFFSVYHLEKYANTSFRFQVSGYFQYLDPYSISFGFLSHWFFANSVIITASYLLDLPALLALMTIGDNRSCLCYGFICIFCHTSKDIIKTEHFFKSERGGMKSKLGLSQEN